MYAFDNVSWQWPSQTALDAYTPQPGRACGNRSRGSARVTGKLPLYQLHSRVIYNFVWRLVGESADAEDLTQETFLKAHSELKKLRDPAQFKYWLYRIAPNEVYQKLRKSQPSVPISVRHFFPTKLD